MGQTQTTPREIELVAHTTCGLEFEFVDAHTGKSLSDRMFFCSDEDLEEGMDEGEGVERFTKIAEKNGMKVVAIGWS